MRNVFINTFGCIIFPFLLSFWIRKCCKFKFFLYIHLKTEMCDMALHNRIFRLQIVTSARRFLTCAVMESASTHRAATAVCATMASRPPPTRPCAWVGTEDGVVITTSGAFSVEKNRVLFVFQTSTSVRGSRVETVPVRTRWDPTTASVSPDSSSLTIMTAWVRSNYWTASQKPFPLKANSSTKV